jgi:hypothetical protein
MSGKEIASGNSSSGRVNPDRNLAIPTGYLPKNKASSSSLPSDAASSDGVAEMLGRLCLTPQEADAFVLEDGGDVDLGCPEWAVVGKVLAPNTLHISTIRSALRPA